MLFAPILSDVSDDFDGGSAMPQPPPLLLHYWLQGRTVQTERSPFAGRFLLAAPAASDVEGGEHVLFGVGVQLHPLLVIDLPR